VQKNIENLFIIMAFEKQFKNSIKKTHKFQKTPFHSSLLTRESSEKNINFGTVHKNHL